MIDRLHFFIGNCAVDLIRDILYYTEVDSSMYIDCIESICTAMRKYEIDCMHTEMPFLSRGLTIEGLI